MFILMCMLTEKPHDKDLFQMITGIVCYLLNHDMNGKKFTNKSLRQNTITKQRRSYSYRIFLCNNILLD